MTNVTTKRLFRPFNVLMIVALAIVSQSCQKSVAEEDILDVEPLREFIATTTAHPLERITWSASKKEFKIDGDGVMSLQQARDHFKQYQQGSTDVPSGAAGTSRSQQRTSYYTVSPTKASNIRIYVDGSVPSVWHSAIDGAISNWNSTGSNIYMTRVYTSTTTTTSTNTVTNPIKGKGKNRDNSTSTTTTTTTAPAYDILITTNYEASSTIATAYYPNSTGNPGHMVTINTYHNGLADSYKLFAITHEFGHNIGFTHTDGTYGNIVPGTPALDPNSVMNSVCLSWSSFTNYDVLAVQTVY